jgi:hypothetical protein
MPYAEKMEASEMVAGFVPTPLMLVGECCLLSLTNDVVRPVPPPPGAANLACRAPTSLNKHCPVKFAAGNAGAASSKIPASFSQDYSKFPPFGRPLAAGKILGAEKLL